jgi:tRNA U34 2-thiouridine synthase MnmA/TrmU
MKKALLIMGIAIFAFASTLTAETYSAAILPFSEKSSTVKKQGAQVMELLFAELSTDPNLWLVERAEMDKIMKELSLSASGMVNKKEANKIGEMTGAKLLITGSVFQIRGKTFIVAKVIGTETSRVIGASARGKESLEVLSAQLAKKISAQIVKRGKSIMPEVRTTKNVVAQLKKELKDQKLPTLFIKIKEQHVSHQAIDPAAQTELQKICQQLGFKLTDDKDKADVVVSGEAISQFATRRGDLVSVRARVEVKATDKTGKILGVDEQTSVSIGMAELIVAKTALKEAALAIAPRLIPQLIKK